MKKALRTYHTSALLLGLLLITTGCNKKPHTSMHQEELATELQISMDGKLWREAISCLEHLVKRYPDSNHIGTYKLQLANLYFQKKEYASAKELYDHFAQVYPSEAQAEYARFQAITCQAKQANGFDQDQSATKKTVKMCKDYLDTKHLQAYRTQVAALLEEHEHKLIDAEFSISDFYRRRHQPLAAQKRLEYLEKTYLPRYPDLAPRLALCQHKVTKELQSA